MLDDDGFSQQAFSSPSNSPKNKILRAHKQYDIQDTLNEVSKYEKTQKGVPFPSETNTARSTDLPDLNITRPAYVEPPAARYRKQGLTKNDYNKYLKNRDEADVYTPAASFKSLPNTDRMCSCREFDDESEEVLHCSAPICPVGWYHLRCTVLDRLPNTTELFFCIYCSDKVDAAEIRPLTNGEAVVVLESPLSAQFATNDLDTGDEHERSLLELDAIDTKHMGANERIYKWKAVIDPASSPHEDSPTASNSGHSSDSDDTSVTDVLASEAAEDKEASTITVALPSDNHSLCSASFCSNEESDVNSASKTTGDIPDTSYEPSTISQSGLSRTDDDQGSPPPSIDPPTISLVSDESAQPQTPKTPTRTREYKSSKPWGTPINYTPSTLVDKIEALPIQTPPSPTPAKKRKLNEIEGMGRVLRYGEQLHNSERAMFLYVRIT